MPKRLPQFDFSGYYNEPEVNPISMAMELLGMESKERGEEKSQAMDLYKLLQDRKAAEATLGMEREKLGETRAGNVSARELAKMEEERLGRALTEDVADKKAKQELARQQLIADALGKVAGATQLSPEVRLLIKNIPGMEEPFTKMEQETEMKTVLPKLQAAYAGDPAKRDAAIKMLYGEMSPHARENVNWQDLNQLIAPDKPGFWSRFSGSETPPTAGTVTEPTATVSEGYPLGEAIKPPPVQGYGAAPGVTMGPSLPELIMAGQPEPAPARPTIGYFTPEGGVPGGGGIDELLKLLTPTVSLQPTAVAPEAVSPRGFWGVQ